MFFIPATRFPIDNPTFPNSLLFCEFLRFFALTMVIRMLFVFLFKQFVLP